MPEIEFAPLQGYTDAAYRRFHHEIYGGCISHYYAPFVRLEKGEVRSKDFRDLLPENNAGISLVPQVIANSAEEFNALVDAIAPLGYTEIDINMGCPFPLQTARRRGAGLLPEIDAASAILHEAAKRQEISFSVKMRLGLKDKEDCLKLLPIINGTPLRQVTMHPRVGSQQYKGTTDKEIFRAFYESVNHPIVYNGDLTSAEEISEIMQEFPRLKGVMIGRGLLATPSLAMEWRQNEIFSEEKRLTMMLALHDRLWSHYAKILQGDAQILMKMKTFWDYAEPAIGHRCHKAIKKSSSLAKYTAAVAALR